METIHSRDFRKVYMIDCLEGQGTQESPSRIVHYIYDDNADQMIGKIDRFKDSLHENK